MDQKWFKSIIQVPSDDNSYVLKCKQAELKQNRSPISISFDKNRIESDDTVTVFFVGRGWTNEMLKSKNYCIKHGFPYIERIV